VAVRLSGKVKIDDRWAQYRHGLEQETAKALMEAARVGAAAARAKPSRYNIASIKDRNRVDIPTRHPRGWYIDIRWTDFRARFFEKGTYQKLGRRVSARSRAGVEGNRGVKPQRFMALARRVGRRELILALNRRLR